MNTYPLVSIIIPTKNSSLYLENCLKSVQKQSYRHIEIIIVDGKSTDGTVSIAKKYKTRIFFHAPKVPIGTFDAPYKRNYGVKKAKGLFVYYIDADMQLTKDVVSDAVSVCKNKYDAIIVPEDSFGTTIWAEAKNLERRCYWGDATIEAPRFFKKKVWEKLGGLDEKLGGGGDDWDLYQKAIESGYNIGRIESLVLHNEGNLRLWDLFKKRFMYGKDTVKYIAKRPKAAVVSYFPIRKAYLRNWKLFLQRPKDTFFFVIMRFSEYLGGFLGILYNYILK